MVDKQTILSGARLLVVDDTPENLDLMRQALESVGCEVMVATTGERALVTAQRQAPELILLDVMMPGIDGFVTCRRLKQDAATQAIPIIFLSPPSTRASTWPPVLPPAAPTTSPSHSAKKRCCSESKCIWCGRGCNRP